MRLSELARRLLELQPAPPREVALSAAWSVYAPLAIYQALGLMAVMVAAAFLSSPQVLLAVIIVFVFVGILSVFFWAALAARLRSYLQDGVTATAVVVQPAGPRTPPRVQVNGRETILRSYAPRRVKAGDRISVLTNPAGDRVWLSLD